MTARTVTIERKEWIVSLEFSAFELLQRHSGQEGDARQHVSMRTDCDVVWPECLTEQLGTGGGGEAPVVGCHLRWIRDTADGGHGRQQHTTRLKHAMGVANRRIGSVNVLQRLRENEAIEAVGR